LNSDDRLFQIHSSEPANVLSLKELLTTHITIITNYFIFLYPP